MPDKFVSVSGSISPKEVLIEREKFLPTITVWNRLEGRPRSNNFERALRAEVRDPLWMLARQWQMGEFKGDDAGSAVIAKARVRQDVLIKFQAGDGDVTSFDRSSPLEVQVEHQNISFTEGGQEISLDIRLLMGRQWLKLIKSLDSGGHLKDKYISHPNYRFAHPDQTSERNTKVCVHIKVWQHFSAVANRCVDGFSLYRHLKDGGKASDGIDVSPSISSQLDQLGLRFVSWYEALFYQSVKPEGNPSWEPSSLEHRFACSSTARGGEKVYCADEYYHGHLDWYNLDIDPVKKRLGNELGKEPKDGLSTTLSFFPGSISFPGMPNARWWEFEDREVSFNDLPQSTKDIHKLLVLDF